MRLMISLRMMGQIWMRPSMDRLGHLRIRRLGEAGITVVIHCSVL